MKTELEIWDPTDGKGIDDLLAMGGKTQTIDPALHRNSSSAGRRQRRSKPDPLDDAAFIGLAGNIVRTIEPHSEADPAAVLVQLLAAFGSAAGRYAFITAGADKHFPNLFVSIVGATCVGAKGSSLSPVLRLLKAADPEWESRVAMGLSSGEGLIWHVRDQSEKQQPVRESGRVVGYDTVIEDHGVPDKRLLVTETELGGALKVMSREGNTLSPTLRQAWDGGRLQLLNKNSPVHATDPHISIIGHITPTELDKYLNAGEAFNGFANRFLWVWSQRSKLLPDGGALDTVDLAPLQGRLSEALAFARQIRKFCRDDDAAKMWHAVYAKLTGGRAGLFGGVTARAAPQVMRLALIYALLDCSYSVGQRHLSAALAIWAYCEDSARVIFGESTGNPVADRLLTALSEAPEGLKRSELNDALGRNVTAARIDGALSVLEEGGLACCDHVATAGRTAERWRRA